MEVRNLHKSFGSAEILAGLDLMFQDDAITTILGPSGTGKSVLIKHLVGLLE
ncbi:MAG TPA: ATP-binding cassette domain-containing protein, partial [Pseudonocardia sp.]|uniref:ATP-binding cassette domain-containing protein n=1 Tax=Pseudonocardia sp. TaxID=60912 RepID=UPI002D03C16F